MLSNEQIKEVMRLLETGQHSRRQIAKIIGTSRIMVYRIERGKKRLQPTIKKEREDEDRHKRPFERCPVCGGRVQLPCIACVVSKLDKVKTFRCNKPESLKLALEDEHRKRYEKIKEWREKQDDPDFTVLPEEWPFRRKPAFVTVTKNKESKK